MIIIPSKEDTVEGLKEDLSYVTGVKTEDQKLYKDNKKNQENEKNEAIGEENDNKTLQELGLMTAGGSGMLLMVTPSSSFEAITSVMPSYDESSKEKEDDQKKQSKEKKEEQQEEKDCPKNPNDDDDD